MRRALSCEKTSLTTKGTKAVQNTKDTKEFIHGCTFPASSTSAGARATQAAGLPAGAHGQRVCLLSAAVFLRVGGRRVPGKRGHTRRIGAAQTRRPRRRRPARQRRAYGRHEDALHYAFERAPPADRQNG